MTKPVTHQGDLAKLPRALAPLLDRKQWCIWRWTPKPDGNWQKPPFIATHPDRHANIKDASTWTDYTTALAAVQFGQGDGISYVLTADDPFAAIDLDHCRDELGGVDVWAQLFLERGRNTYGEVTPSGTGCRIWGLAAGEKLHRKQGSSDHQVLQLCNSLCSLRSDCVPLFALEQFPRSFGILLPGLPLLPNKTPGHFKRLRFDWVVSAAPGRPFPEHVRGRISVNVCLGQRFMFCRHGKVAPNAFQSLLI
jgi:hypothetical protein